MELTSKQRRYLRSLGQTRSPLATIGKAGLSESMISNISTLLDRHELIKVRLADDITRDRSEQADEIARSCGATIVGIVGKSLLLFRPSDELDDRQRIRLPRE